MRRVHVDSDHWNFTLEGTGETISPIGGNIVNDQHPGQGTVFDRWNAADVDRRLGLMAELGMNCLRQAIGINRVFDARTGLKAEGLRNWDAFLGLCERHGIYVMAVGGYLGGNDWFDVERLADQGANLEDSTAFWRAFARHNAGNPAIWAWDLRNELLFWPRAHMVTPGSPDEVRVAAMIADRWPRWLEVKYGSVAAMNRAHGQDHAGFTSVPWSVTFVEKPFDLCAADFRCYLNDRGYDWCRPQCDAIRQADPGRMICSGNNTWLCPDQDLFLANGFHSLALHDLFDFTTHHPYPAWQAVPGGRGDPLDGGPAAAYWLSACIGASRLEHLGKPVVLQEFGWYGGGESRFLGPLPYRSEQEHADYTRTLIEALIPHTNGFLNWPTFDMPAAEDISNHGGVFTADGRPKVLASVYRDFASRLTRGRQHRIPATETIQVSRIGLYTCRSYQDRMWDQVHAIVSSGGTPDFRFI